MKKRNRGGARRRRPPAIPLRNALAILFFTFSFASAQAVDVIIVGKPGSLLAYDAYQQSVKPGEVTALRPFAPMVVLNAHDVLGDGLTPCTKVEVEGEIFYLLRDERGHLAGSADLGTVRLLQNVKPLKDTVEILAPDRVVFQKPIGSGKRTARIGETFLRLFDSGGTVYARRLGSDDDYGWLSLAAAQKNRWWRIARAEASRLTLSPMIKDRVLERMSGVNRAYAQVYALLERQTNKSVPVPQWSVQPSGDGLTCTLTPSAAAKLYNGSIAALVANLQTYVLDSGYQVLRDKNVIRIVRR